MSNREVVLISRSEFVKERVAALLIGVPAIASYAGVISNNPELLVGGLVVSTGLALACHYGKLTP